MRKTQLPTNTITEHKRERKVGVGKMIFFSCKQELYACLYNIAANLCLNSSIGGWSGLSMSRTQASILPAGSPTLSLKSFGKRPHLSEVRVSWRSMPVKMNPVYQQSFLEKVTLYSLDGTLDLLVT
jgi:hypothetical protein